MASSAFDGLPPFPSDVPVANISKISLARLVDGNKAVADAEAKAMLDACRGFGFFLLDLAGDSVGEAMIQQVDAIFKVVAATMRLDLEEKSKFSQDIAKKDFQGYKAQGIMKTETGQPDRCEFYQISQDDLLGNVSPARPTPAPISAQLPIFESYVRNGQHVLTHLLRALSVQLGLPAETLRGLQPTDRASGTMVRLIRYPPSVVPEDMRTGLLPHTDFGSVTLLANALGGLQVRTDGGEWQWVRPERGCLIVNMGDAMIEWTAGGLRSNLHRVYHAPGEQRHAERISVALLVRPYHEASMKRLAGGRIPSEEDDRKEGIAETLGGIGGLTAWEWELKKGMALKEGKDCMKSRGGRELRPVAISV